MDFLNYLLQLNILENTILAWLWALLVAIAAVLFLAFAKRMLLKHARAVADRNGNKTSLAFVTLANRTRFFFIFLASIYIGSLMLDLPVRAAGTLRVTALVAFLIQMALWVNAMISHWITVRIERELADEAGSATTLNAFGVLAKVAVWTIVALLALQNILGMEVDALIASLGIGGIAIGLAVQNILGDLFASLSIALDKPFVIGDFITVGDFKGNVEHIGLKSTRVRSLSGEQLVFANSDLLGSRIRNFKRMERRRVDFSIGVTYQTSYDQLASIPEIIREIISEEENVTFDRAHLKGYGDFAILYEVAYFMETADYKVYMDTQQRINLKLFKRFAECGIEFAYPTQTVFVTKSNERLPEIS